MENASRKILIVDEGAFHLPPATDDHIRENGGVFAFLYDAKEDFRIILATDREPEDVCRDLKQAKLEQGVFCKAPMPDDFLIEAVISWAECKETVADVFIFGQDEAYYKIDHIRSFRPQELLNTNSYYYFWKNYDEDLSGFEQSAAWLSANIKLHEMALERAMDKAYKDPKESWKKVAAHPAIKALADKMGEAHHHIWEQDHPQTRLISSLKSYFEYLRVRGMGENFQSARNAADCRMFLKADFVMRNIDQAYPRSGEEIINKSPMEYPLIPEHRRLLNKALLAIHGIVKAEPRPGN